MSRGGRNRKRATTLEDVQGIHPTPMQEREAQQRAGLATGEALSDLVSYGQAFEKIDASGVRTHVPLSSVSNPTQEANTMSDETKPPPQTIYIKESARVRAPAVQFPSQFDGAATEKRASDDVEKRFVEMATEKVGVPGPALLFESDDVVTDKLLAAAAAMFGGVLISRMHSHNIDDVMADCVNRAFAMREMIVQRRR